jgi:competence ComEA-like helix-hairpin-helix protein
MMRKIIFILFIFLIISNVSAMCEEGQIDINSATLEELDNLPGIGPVKAQAIIDSRTFQSVDELIDVYGIGEITLNKIKEQGLACVIGETEEIQEQTNNETSQDNEDSIPIDSTEEPKDVPEEQTQSEIIKLNPQDIKSENSSENLDVNNYATYGFIVFCVLLVFLFILRRNRFNKNEFE